MYRVGVIGGGQLARMMQPAAIALGIELKVLAETPDSSARAAASMVGDYRDLETLRKFAATVDVITFDHEHVPVDLLVEIQGLGTEVRPGPGALIHAQNKLVMRRALADLSMPQPAWREIRSAEDLVDFLEGRSSVIVKTPIGGYDGKGVRVVYTLQDVADWLENISAYGGSLLAEEKVDFVRELSQLTARSPRGELAAWPLVQTVQRAGVCSEVIAPAPASEHLKNSVAIAKTISEGLGVVGVLAVEMFEDRAGNLLVNELAMRPHNSGHFSIEGSMTSQFEQHLRAVLDLPLGSTSPTAPYAVMLNLLGVDDKNTFVENYPQAMNSYPEVKYHSYEKRARAGRKMGHITLLGDNWEELLERGNKVRQILYGQAE
jgi:5-(carboxyamino)imidazole ribonucleotide synthase